MSRWIVVGGGIVGAACAYFLAAERHEVTLLERAGLTSGTSSSGQSNIGVPPGAGDAFPYFQAAAETYQILRDQGFDLGFQRHGHLYVARDSTAAGQLLRDVEQVREAGLATHILTTSEIRSAQPRLSAEVEVAVLLPSGAQVSPMQTVFELSRAARTMGARIVTGTEVRGISVIRGQFDSVETTAGRIHADGIVIAAGAWSQHVAGLAGLNVPVRPRKGHVLVTEPAAGWMSHTIIDYGFDAALLEGSASTPEDAIVGSVIQPLPTGNLLIGGSAEGKGFDRVVDRHTLMRIGMQSLELMPAIGSLRVIRTYAGLRPWTPDGWPIIGACPEIDGVVFATGHNSAGINAGPVTGRIVADVVAGRRPIFDTRPLSPDRFGSLTSVDPTGAPIA